MRWPIAIVRALVLACAGAAVAAGKDLTATNVERIGMGTPESVPAGRYARQVLEQEALWDKLQPKLVFGQNVRQVLDYVARAEVDAGIDRIVCFAGWSDKIASLLGNQNPVAQPFHNFTVPEPVGTLGVIAPESSSFLGFLSLWLPAVCAGNTVVCMASEHLPLPALLVAESMPNSDIPAGVFNLLTGTRKELLSEALVEKLAAAGIHAHGH